MFDRKIISLTTINGNITSIATDRICGIHERETYTEIVYHSGVNNIESLRVNMSKDEILKIMND